MLQVGASRWEATRALVQRSITAAMSPTLAHMSALGLATLPSFMAGQLLGGVPPIQVRSLLLRTGATAAAVAAAALSLAPCQPHH